MIANIFIIALLVESIVLHEMAHGYVALLFGDKTAKHQGRLTLNPIPHIDPVWTVIIPIAAYILSKGTFIIGGAKPVPVNPFNYRRPVLGDICVSVAGVAVNFLIAVIMILLLNIVQFIFGGPQETLAVHVLLNVALLNIVLAMFNLIPIPPLDGSHLFKYLLPQELQRSYENLGRTGVGFIILIILINIPGLWNIFNAVLFGLRDFLLKTLIVF
ncbi:MAG: site-2 protease family protein [Desulfobacterales bacterium]|jgi:Zn-dependent protease|nr:site-2 protease family protein [Desulfobacterales bacterium]